ncbi:MAG: 23S rRNA (adenine(2503)-C(2))-methyltransferase RlmN [Anaerolineales bacterium]
MPIISDFSLSELTALLADWGEPVYRARQIWEGLYRHFYASAEEFTALPKALRRRLAETFDFAPLTPAAQVASQDGQTVKTLFRLPDGLHIEAVLMKYDRRRTLCISTQAGCAMGCVFCATGQMGFKRHLTSGEIVAQVMYYARLLQQTEASRVTNIVIMGMGEPFHNYDNTLAAVDRLNDPAGYNFGARRITISTVGLVPAIRRFTQERRQVNLAISLHAADDALRASMLPVAKAYPLDELLAACRDYAQTTGRRVTFEWALIEGVNDTPEQARLLASKVKGMLCHVNAIPLNPTAGYGGAASSRQRAEKFKETLEQAGVPCTIRLRRGIEIQAGCGQLVFLG